MWRSRFVGVVVGKVYQGSGSSTVSIDKEVTCQALKARALALVMDGCLDTSRRHGLGVETEMCQCDGVSI